MKNTAMQPGPFGPPFPPPTPDTWDPPERHRRRRSVEMSAEGPDPRDEDGRGRRGRGPRGPHGPGPGGPRGFGFGGPGWGPPGGPWGGPGGRRRDRGDVRAAVLLLLAEKPRHGYEIITELADRSDGRWRVSPGSVYPVLKRLTKEGLVLPSHEDDRRVFRLTPEGDALVAEKRESWGEPWAQQGGAGADAAADLWDEARQLAGAAWQVAQSGDAALVEQAVSVLAEARKSIYRLLAEH